MTTAPSLDKGDANTVGTSTQMTTRTCEVCGGERFANMGELAEHHFERCEGCGLERIDPQPTDETLAQIYGAHYYDAWGLHQDKEAVEELKRGTFRRILKGAGALPKGAKILDCGAATGFLMGVAKDLGYEPYGVELSEFGAGEIAKRFGEDRVHQGHLEQAPFADGTFDAIFMCDFLEHVRDPVAIAERAHALLRPGGVLAISMPRVGSFTNRVMKMRWTHYKVEHLFYFSVANLGQLLRRLGFGRYDGKTLVKTMNLRYIAHQFAMYPHPLLTPAVKAATRILPSALQRRQFPIAMGELVAYARKS
jgi:2-polyprenyl-3-methyl-5-hydroxy-6-metoxy-1,4-benzoquinol methylase